MLKNLTSTGTRIGSIVSSGRERTLRQPGWLRLGLMILTFLVFPTLQAEEATIAEILGEEDPDLAQIEAQIEAGEYEIPEAWLQQKIQAIESSSHRFDPALVRPITLLGDIQAIQGDYVGALDNYGRAVHLERVNSGLVAPEQVEIVYREAEVYRALGDFKTANEREEYAYHVLRSAHDPYNESLLPGIYHLAGWYMATHNLYAARSLYQSAIHVLNANGKGTTPEAIPALQGLVRTYKLERFPPFYSTTSNANSYSTFSSTQGSSTPIPANNFPAGEQALQVIVQIRRDYSVDDPEVLADAVVDLADWYLLFDKTRRAFPLYEHAYLIQESIEGFDVFMEYSEPKLIYFPAPTDPKAPPANISSRETQGHVEVGFDVTDDGNVRNLKTLASEPEGMMDFRVRKSIRVSRFRPALVNGKPIDTIGQIYLHTFTYYPEVGVAAQSPTDTTGANGPDSPNNEDATTVDDGAP